MAKKKDFTKKNPSEDKDHVLESAKEGEKSTELREDINLWRRSISKSVRLQTQGILPISNKQHLMQPIE